MGILDGLRVRLRRRRRAGSFTDAAPSQEALDRLLEPATRLLVTEVMGGELLLDVRDPAEVAALAKLLRISPGERFHCMCPGDQNLEIRGPRARRTTITLHHGRSIRWDGEWGSDALLADPRGLLEWLAAHGADGPLRRWERDREDERRVAESWEAWKAAAPPCLTPILQEISQGAFGRPDDAQRDRATSALRAASADEADAVLALLAWYGRGGGPWTGYLSWEDVPGWLLLGFPTERILRALEDSRAEPEHLEGAARLLSWWWFGSERPGDLGLCSDDLARRLLASVEASTHPENAKSLREMLQGREG